MSIPLSVKVFANSVGVNDSTNPADSHKKQTGIKKCVARAGDCLMSNSGDSLCRKENTISLNFFNDCQCCPYSFCSNNDHADCRYKDQSNAAAIALEGKMANAWEN